ATAALLRPELSRSHAWATFAGRRRVLQGRVRSAASGMRAGSVRGSVSPGGRATVKGRRRLHRRAGPGSGGDVAARWLPAGGICPVPTLWHAVRRRRGPDRAGPHGELVRVRALGT